MKFYAVTATSLYEINDENGNPAVEKIQLKKGSFSKVKVGKNLCEGGDVVYLSRYGIYSIEKKSMTKDKNGEVDGGFGAHTSPIIGLFLKKDEAVECLNSENRTVCDRRWKKQTLEVLLEIGSNNPVFIVAKDRYNSFKY